MIYYDTHVHSYRSFVGSPNMSLKNIVEEASKLGIDAVAITDHLMKPEDIADLRITGQEIRDFRQKNNISNLLFGIEVCEIDPLGNTLLTRQLIDDLGAEVIIGGVHETHMPAGSSLADIVSRQCKHHIMMMENPLIEILVHPWWLDKAEFERLGFTWPADMSFIPKERVIELAKASGKTGTYIEISTMSGLCNSSVSESFRAGFKDYYRTLNENGALFAIGSDTHELSEMSTYGLAKQLVSDIGIDENRFYKPNKSIKRRAL